MAMLDQSGEEALWEALKALQVAVIVSPTRISVDPQVVAAMDASVLTRAGLKHQPLDGLTRRQICQRLIDFWTIQRDSDSSLDRSVAKGN